MIDISRLTPQQLDRFLHVQSIIDRQAANAAKVRALRDYYYGDHPVLLTLRQTEYLGELAAADSFTPVHNLARSVLDTLRERVSVTGVSVGDDEASAGTLWQWWNANRMAAQQIRLHRRALRDGVTYLMVDYDAEKQRPRFTLHKCDDGKTGVTVHRDPENAERVLFVNRYFYTYDPLKPGETGKERKTTYLPDQIRKYQRGGAGWEPVMDEGDASWPLAWVDARGLPLGIPVIEFANPGGSEIEQILGLQNGLNKAWLDLFAATDASGFPVLAAEYADGIPLPTGDDADIEGEDELRVAPGRVLEIFGGTIKRIEAANLTPMLDAIWAIVAAIAGVSRTPQYYLRPIGGADVPSGEALKQLESGLVKRAEERQLLFGESWQDAFALAWRLEQTFGQSLPDIDADSIEVQWEDANVRNEVNEAAIAEAHKRLGVPDAELWRRLGYTPEEIADFTGALQAAQLATISAVAQQMRQVAQAQPVQQQPTERNGNL